MHCVKSYLSPLSPGVWDEAIFMEKAVPSFSLAGRGQLVETLNP